MSVIASALKHMLAAGMPADAIVAAVAEMEASLASSDPVAEKRRAYDRERKRVSRQNVSTGLPPESTDKADIADTAPFPAPSPSFPPDPQTNPTPTHTRDNTTRPRKADDFPKPEWADTQVWSDFMANRKAKKARNTVTAYRGFLTDIEKFASAEWPPGRLLEHAAAKGWAGIYEPEKQDKSHGNDRKSSSQRDRGRVDGFTAALRKVANSETDHPFAGHG